MTPIRIVKGLDVPIAGAPDQVVTGGQNVSSVALIGADYPGLRPLIKVEEGQRVKLGQPLFSDRLNERVQFTAPGSGCVTAINRGARRRLKSVVIGLDGTDELTFRAWPRGRLATLDRDEVVQQLLLSGLWTALRTRPFGYRADPDASPAAVFVTAMDSNPLAARAEVIVNNERAAFADGLTVISHLTDGRVYVCQAPRAGLPNAGGDNVVPVEFSGPHPSGLVGTHIHILEPVAADKTVWHLDCQDVVAIGKLFTRGRLSVGRVVSLAGPPVKRPRLVRTRLGASITDLTAGEIGDEKSRIISGSILSGRRADKPEDYIGRFHRQISVLAEPASGSAGGPERFSAYSIRVTGRPSRRKFRLTTAQGGNVAPMVPFGGYDRVMPLDVLPTPLLRALMVGDTDMAQALGCLELVEEDLSLCAFVCPGKIDHGSFLRQTLDRIEKEG